MRYLNSLIWSDPWPMAVCTHQTVVDVRSRYRTSTVSAGARVRSAQVRAQAADDRAQLVHPVIEQLRSAGIRSLRALAEGLNERGICTRRGSAWCPSSVKRMLDRFQQAGRAV